MYFQPSPYALPLASSVMMCVLLALLAWRRRPAPGAKLLALLMVAAAELSFAYMFELTSAQLAGMMFWVNVQWVGYVSLPLVWFAFVLAYTGRGRLLSRRNVALALIEPVLTLVTVWTNEYHHGFYSSAIVQTSGSSSILALGYGPYFWLQGAYTYCLILVGCVLILQSTFGAHRLYRGQAIALLTSALFPLLGNALYVIRVNPFPYVHLAPFAFTFSGLALIWAYFRYRLLDVIPVARAALLEGMEDGVIVVDAQGRVVDLNMAGQRILGRPSVKTVGRPVSEFFADWPGFPIFGRDASPEQVEVNLSKGEVRRYYEVRNFKLFGRNGRLTGWLLILRDITELRETERELRQANAQLEAALRVRDEMIQNVSHELRAPLTVLLCSLELLAEGKLGSLSAQQKDLVGVLGEQTERLHHMIERLLALQSFESENLRRQLLDLGIWLSRHAGQWRARAEREKIALNIDVPDQLPFVRADERFLAQVVDDLLDNAFKFGSSGGEITVSAAATEREVLMIISDHGIGIPLDKQSQIFRRFYQVDGTTTRRYGGMGLGLALVYRIVEAHGGRVWVESEGEGRGASFYVALPQAVEMLVEAPLQQQPL